MSHDLPLYDDIRKAASRIDKHIISPPLLTSEKANAALGGAVYIKAESLQQTGSFKLRGASNAVSMLDDTTRCVVAWSSGNHAQAVALACRNRGIKAIIIIPSDAPRVKIDTTRTLGAEIVTYDRYTENREDIGTAIAAEHNAAIIPPFDFAPIIAGQGTVGLEIVETCQKRGIIPDQLVCCTGGGGLIAGISLSLHEHMPKTTIIAAEPEHYDDFARSLKAGKRLKNADNAPPTLCDAIAAPMPGALPFAIARDHVSHGVSVSDDEVLDAMAFAWAEYNIVVEPGGAVALAAACAGKIDLKDKKTVLIVSGGNVDLPVFKKALARLQP